MGRVSELYDLDLPSINRAIYEINSALDAVQPEEEEQSPEYSPIIWQERIGTYATKLEKDGLTLEDGTYMLHFEARASAATTYSLYFNNDQTSTRYRSIYMYSANGAAVSATGSDASYLGENEASGHFIVNGILSITKTIGHVTFFFKSIRHPTDLFTVGSIHYTGLANFDNIFNLQIISSATGQIGKDSHLDLWRVSWM